MWIKNVPTVVLHAVPPSRVPILFNAHERHIENVGAAWG